MKIEAVKTLTMFIILDIVGAWTHSLVPVICLTLMISILIWGEHYNSTQEHYPYHHGKPDE